MTVYLEPTGKGRPVLLDKAIALIGRHPDCDIVLKRSKKVSRKHCCIAQVDGRLVLRDLGSMNGVRLNGKRIKHEATVRPGDEIQVGDVAFKLRGQQVVVNEKGAAKKAPDKQDAPPPAAAQISGEQPLPIADNDELEDAEAEDEEAIVLEETPESMPVQDNSSKAAARKKDDRQKDDRPAPQIDDDILPLADEESDGDSHIPLLPE